MPEIKIHEFIDYDQKALLEFLLLQNETEFHIIILKSSRAHKDENFVVYWQYYFAAWSGQKLSEIASSFAYYVPSEYKELDFRFEIVADDMEKLSEVLFLIINGNYHPNEAYHQFHDEGTLFFENAYKGTIKVATWGLINIARKYLD
jgi:hypothetical protein